MSLLIDVIVIAAFAICFFSGIKKGFVKSVMGIAVVALSIVGSMMISPKLVPYINDNYVKEPVVSAAQSSINGLFSETVNFDKLVESPDPLFDVFKRFGVKEEHNQEIVDSVEGEETDDIKVGKIAERIGAPVAMAISKALAFVAVFVALMIVLFIAALILSLVVKLPVLKAADKLLGGVVGAVMGILLCWGLSLAICALMPHLSTLYEDVPKSVIDNSIVVKYLGGIDPLKLFGK